MLRFNTYFTCIITPNFDCDSEQLYLYYIILIIRIFIFAMRTKSVDTISCIDLVSCDIEIIKFGRYNDLKN